MNVLPLHCQIQTKKKWQHTLIVRKNYNLIFFLSMHFSFQWQNSPVPGQECGYINLGIYLGPMHEDLDAFYCMWKAIPNDIQNLCRQNICKNIQIKTYTMTSCIK